MRIPATALLLIALAVRVPAQSVVIRWESTGGPRLPDVMQLITQRDRVLMVVHSGWWQSFDAGATWRLRSPSATPKRLSANNRYLFGEAVDGVIRSSDLGDSWMPCGELPMSGPPRRVVTSIVADQDRVYAVVSGLAVFRSMDQCATWTQLTAPWSTKFPVTIRHVSALRVIVLANEGTFISQDAGSTWALLDRAVVSDRPPFATTCDGALLAGAQRNGTVVSADGGRTWTPRGPGDRRILALAVPRCGEVFAVAWDPGRNTTSVFRSQNDAVSWSRASEGLIRDAFELAADADGSVYVAGSSGAFRWSPQSDWRQVGPVATRVESVVVTPAGDIFAAGQGRLHRLRPGGSWTPVRLEPPATPRRLVPDEMPALRVFVTSKGNLLAESLQSGLFKSRDRGETWAPAGLERNTLAMTSTRDGSILAGTREGIFRSDDDGETWVERSIGLAAFRIGALGAGPDGTVYAVGYDGGAYRSTDEGDRWRPIGAPRARGAQAMLALKTGGLLLGGPTGLFRWDSTATAWQAVSLPSQGTAVDVRALYEDARGMVLAGTERNGVFASFDDGITWSAANDGLTADGVLSFAVDSEGRIVAGTSAGLFRTVR